jgi:hypothetical protein
MMGELEDERKHEIIKDLENQTILYLVRRQCPGPGRPEGASCLKDPAYGGSSLPSSFLLQ